MSHNAFCYVRWLRPHDLCFFLIHFLLYFNYFKSPQITDELMNEVEDLTAARYCDWTVWIIDVYLYKVYFVICILLLVMIFPASG